MTTKATRNAQDTTSEGTLCVSCELRDKNWKLGFTTGHGQKPRERTVTARDQQRVLDEIAQATRRCGLPATAPVGSCDAASREGFWRHRFLEAHGMTHQVGDSSAMEVSRRQRRATSDGLAVRQLLRVSAHHTFLSEQIAEVEAARRALLQTSPDASLDKVRQLMMRKGIGSNGAWLLVREFFGGRAFKNRRAVGGFAGFTPTPYHRGESAREQGMSKSGNRHGRWMTTELAWSGRRDQPERALRVWCRERFGSGGKRLRRLGMVAVARQFLLAHWRFLETGVFPEGAVLKEG